MLAGCVGIGGAGLVLKDTKAEGVPYCPFKPKTSCPWFPRCASQCPLTAVPQGGGFPVGFRIVDPSNEVQWVKVSPGEWGKWEKVKP